MDFPLLIIHMDKLNVLRNYISSSVFTGYSEEYQLFHSCCTVNHLSCHHSHCESVFIVQTYVEVKVYLCFLNASNISCNYIF